MNILLGISGSIAAYKIPGLIRLFQCDGHVVKCIVTRAGSKFVTDATLETITRNSVYRSMFRRSGNFEIEHISLAEWADIMLVVPASANTIARLAHGFAGDLLSCVALSVIPRKPLLLCPAMNHYMYEHPLALRNLALLKEIGARVLPPEEGELACGVTGKGRLPALERIRDWVYRLSSFPASPLRGKSVLITAGRTVEPLDPVRYISNYSSGKMGFALAQTACERGAEVTVICGAADVDFTQLPIRLINVRSAIEMESAFFREYRQMKIVVAAAAVCDYRPAHRDEHKIKKTDQLNLTLIKNPDILARAGNEKNDQFLVGFAVETQNVIEYGRKKLTQKNLDMIVINNPLNPGSEFGGDTNRITILTPDEVPSNFPLQSKADCSIEIWNAIEYRLSL